MKHRLTVLLVALTCMAASASRPGMTYPTWNPGKPLEVTVGDVSGVYCDSDDYVYFNDNHSTRVQVLIPGVGNDPTKGLIRTFNATASPGTFGTQGSITKDSNGNFYVASKNRHKIVKMIPKKLVHYEFSFIYT